MSNKVKKMTVRIQEDIHKTIMKMLIDIDMSFQDYVMMLIEEDMKKCKD